MPQPKTETEREKLLRETVFETCDRLAREGRKPTNRVVREALGSGSMSDIQPLVKVWRERRDAAALAAMAAPEAPPEFQYLWPTVWRLASRAYEAERRAWDEDRRDLETSLEDLRAEAAAERALREGAQGRLRESEAEAAALRDAAERGRKTAEERIDALERRCLKAEAERDAWQAAMSGFQRDGAAQSPSAPGA